MVELMYGIIPSQQILIGYIVKLKHITSIIIDKLFSVHINKRYAMKHFFIFSGQWNPNSIHSDNL